MMKSRRESHGKRNDLTGQRFGRLTAFEDIGHNAHNARLWLCHCDCGKYHVVTGSDLRRGHSKSCGCYNLDRIVERNTTHGGCYTRLHKIWVNMTSRCYIPSSTRWTDYGGRGITVCEEWIKNFSAFREWAYTNGYTDKLTIEREDTNGNYTPENCKWIPIADQSRNKRNNVRIMVGDTTKILTVWLKEIKSSRCAYDNRIRKGMSPEDAILDIMNKSNNRVKEAI